MALEPNYAGEVLLELTREIREKKLEGDSDHVDLQYIKELVDEAVHFTLPDHGIILNDGKKGILNEELHLPFKTISLSFPMSVPEDHPGNFKDSRQFVVATSLDYQECVKWLDRYNINIVEGSPISEVLEKYGFLLIHSSGYVGNRWIFGPYLVMLPKNYWDVDDEGLPTIKHKVIYTQDNALDTLKKRMSPDRLVKAVESSKLIACGSVLELIEALSCSNVSYEKVKYDKTKASYLKLKNNNNLKEINRIVIDTHRPEGKGFKRGSASHTKSQHLRRGHIRKYESGKKIWVNSCVVGEGTVVPKNYVVR